DDGEPTGCSHILPRTIDELRRRREMIKLWADQNGGMLGRTPDFMNVMFAGYAAAHEYFAQGGRDFGDNIRRYHDTLRRRGSLPHPHAGPSPARSVDGDAGGLGGGERRPGREGDRRRRRDP